MLRTKLLTLNRKEKVTAKNKSEREMQSMRHNLICSINAQFLVNMLAQILIKLDIVLQSRNPTAYKHETLFGGR